MAPMRFLTILAFLLAPLAAQAACPAMEQDTIFFVNMPEKELQADVIASVKIVKVEPNGYATAQAEKILKSDGRLARQVNLHFPVGTCGPFPVVGEKGIIIARSGASPNGKPTLYPYTRRFSDDRITPPKMD